MTIRCTPIFFFVFLVIVLGYPRYGRVETASLHEPLKPIYYIPLRIHLGDSERTPQQWLPILEEINHIWLSQANICFTMHTVTHDKEIVNGMERIFHRPP